MQNKLDIEVFESLVAHKLLPVFETAYNTKMQAYEKWWHNPAATGPTTGGRNYASLRAFLIDCARHPLSQFDDGPFLSYQTMQTATSELWKDEEVARQTPHRSDTHVNVTWFTKAGAMFVIRQRFIDGAEALADTVWLYRSNEGLYLIDDARKQHAPRHH